MRKLKTGNAEGGEFACFLKKIGPHPTGLFKIIGGKKLIFANSIGIFNRKRKKGNMENAESAEVVFFYFFLFQIV